MPTPFISRTDLSEYLGRDVEDDPGALIAVDASCEIVKTLTEQDFQLVTGDTATLDGSGTDTILLPQLPVSGAGTVVVNSGTLESDDYVATETGHLIRTDGTATWSTWSSTSSAAAYWPHGRQNIEVTYDHGNGTVPSDVRMVALAIAHRMVVQGAATGETVGPVSKKYAVASTDLTDGERAILRKHRVSQ